MDIAFMAPTVPSDKLELRVPTPKETGRRTEPGAKLFEALASSGARREELMGVLRVRACEEDSLKTAADEFLRLVEQVASRWQALWSKADMPVATLKAPVSKSRGQVLSVVLGPVSKPTRKRRHQELISASASESVLRIIDRQAHGVTILCEDSKRSARGKAAVARPPREKTAKVAGTDYSVSLIRNDLEVGEQQIAPQFLIRGECTASGSGRRKK